MLAKLYKHGPYGQWVVVILGGLSAMAAGAGVQWTSASLPMIRSGDVDLGLEPDSDLSWMVSLVFITNMLATIPSGWIMDKIGRKRTLLIFSTAPIASWVVLLAFHSSVGLYLSRVFVGIWLGILLTVAPMYLGECTQPNLRGISATVFYTFIYAGCLSESIVGFYCTYDQISMISCVVPVLVFLGFLVAPESPYYYLMKGNRKGAEESLRRLWVAGADVETCLTRIENGIKAQQQSQPVSFGFIRIAVYRKAFLIIAALGFFQRTAGITLLMSYGSTFMPDELISNKLSIVVLNLIWMLSSLFGLNFIDRFGRKPMFLISSLGSCISMMVISVWFYLRDHTSVDVASTTWLPLVALMFHGIFVSIGLMPVPGTYQSELFPVSVKANASVGYCILASLASSLVLRLYTPIENSIGLFFNFAICSISGLLGVLFAVFVLFETKGKTLEEIQEMLNDGSTKENKDSV